MASFSQVQARDYPAGDSPFRAAEVSGPQPFYRNELDAMRSMWKRTPNAEYPDGYLGTIQTRRHDRLYDGLKARQNNKPYMRGVHKGERLDKRDYQWPDEFNLMSGLQYEAAGYRFVPPGVLMEVGELAGTQRLGASPPEASIEDVPKRGVPGGRNRTVAWSQPNPDRKNAMKRMAPPWASGPGMGMAVAYPGR